MSKLFFYYSTMSSGKSLEVIKVSYNYEVQGKKVLVATSGLDTRYKKGVIWSRTGFKREAFVFDKSTSFIKMVQDLAHKPNSILIDEAQFLNKRQVIELTELADKQDITIMTYGLKNDSFNELFEGSKYLLIYADSIRELKTECWYCLNKATMNLRFDKKGNPVYEGDQIDIGGDEKYLPVCRKCYKSEPHLQASKLAN